MSAKYEPKTSGVETNGEGGDAQEESLSAGPDVNGVVQEKSPGKARMEGDSKLRKLMILAAMLAMVLVAAAPAFANGFGNGSSFGNGNGFGNGAVAINEGDDTEFNAVAQNISGGFGDVTQVQVADANATASDDSSAVAVVSQDQDISFVQSNSALNAFDGDSDDDGFLDEFEVF